MWLYGVPAPTRSCACLHPAAEFLGVWDVESVLTGVELPKGPELVPDMRVGGGCCRGGAKRSRMHRPLAASELVAPAPGQQW
jgi:hypothetical protein